MEKIARFFQQVGLYPSTRQKPFLCLEIGILGIRFTDRVCPTVESEVVDQELSPFLYAHQEKEIRKKIRSGRNKRRRGNGT